MKERLQKLMARADYGSRRACEDMIRAGRVTINGTLATVGDQADPSVDDVRVDGERLKVNRYKPRYIVFNKPTNVLSVNQAGSGDERPTVRDLIPVEGHFFTIGRLDADSEGLIVLTNDGEIAHKLAHPSFEHTKTYKVIVYGHPSPEVLQKWEEGIWLEGKRTSRCYVKEMHTTPKMTTLRVVMTEGRKRQIRRVASLLGYPVHRLVRTHIGQLGLGTLERGAWYELTEEEVASMLIPAEEIEFIRRKRRKPFVAKPTPATETAKPSTEAPKEAPASSGGWRDKLIRPKTPTSRPARPQGNRPSGNRSEGRGGEKDEKRPQRPVKSRSTNGRGKRPNNARPPKGQKPR